MLVIDTFRVIGKHFVGILSGIYVSGVVARLVAWLWPAARLPAFVILSLVVVTGGLSVMIRELHKGKLTTGIIVLDYMPFLLLSTGLSFVLGQLASRWWGSDWGGMIVFLVIYAAVIGVIGATKETVQEENLKDDLEHQRPADPEEEQKKVRKYMHPYI